MKADAKRTTGKPAGKAQRAKGNGAPPRGRPISYDPVHCTRIVAHAETGAPLAVYADLIGVPPSTLIEWAHVHPEFLNALQLAVAILGLEMARQVAELRGALLLKFDDVQKRLLATTDAAEADQLMRGLSDLGPMAWLAQADSVLAWHWRAVGGQEP